MANEFDQFDGIDPKPIPLERKNEFDQFDAPRATNEFDQLDLPQESEGQKALKSLMSTATKAAVAPGAAAIDLFKAQAGAEEKRLAATPSDPINFNKRDLANPLINPINALSTIGKVAAREEATIAAPLMDLTKKALDVSEGGDIKKFSAKKYWDFVKEAPKTFMDGMRDGLYGTSRSEADPTRQEQLGDIPRLLGAPEPVSAVLGLTASMALPSSLLMNAIPGAKYVSKADNLAKNLVARNNWIAEFQKGTASLKEGKAMIEKLVTQDLEPEALVHLANWRKALRETDNAEAAVKLMARGEAKRDVLETVKGIKPTDPIGPLGVKQRSAITPIGKRVFQGVVDVSPEGRAADLTRALRETQVPISALESIFGGVGYTNPKLGPYRKVVYGVTNAAREHEDQLLRVMDSSVHGLTEASPEVQSKIRLYDLIKQGRNDPAAANAAAVLGAKLGITGTPKLTHQEKAFYAWAKKIVNENKGALKTAYKTVTGKDMNEVADYVFPLLHEKEGRSATQIFSERMATGGGGVIGGGTKRFVDRTVNNSMPRTDIFKLLDEQLQAQAWMKHVLPETRKARTAYMGVPEHGPLPKGIREYGREEGLSRGLGTQEMEYIANLLNTVEHGGSLAPMSVIEKYLKTGRNNITKAMLAYKITTALVQYGALFDGMTMAQNMWGAKGASAFFKSMQENLFSPKFKKNFSKAIANRRSMGSDQAVAEMSGAASSKFAQAGWAPMKRIDATVAQVTREAFKKAMKKSGINAKPEELDMLMEVVSGSPNVAMQPSIIHSSEFARTWFTFQTFALHRWSNLSHNLIENGILAKADKRNADISGAFSKLSKKELFDKEIKTQPFATLTAWKDGVSDAVNLRNMGQLEGTLKRMGYRYKRASGGWFDPASGTVKNKASLFVPGMSEDEAVALGKKYNQYSILSQNGEIRSDGLVRKTSNVNDIIIEKGNKGGRITDEKLPFTEIKVGDETIKFSIPQGKVVMIRPGTLTKHSQSHDVIGKKIRGTIGLIILAAADIAENNARRGLSDMMTGNESPKKSFGAQVMSALPNQIPILGNFINAAMNNSSALPPVPRVLETMLKGGFQTVRGKTPSSRAKGALKTGSSAAALFVGMPGTSQITQFLQNFIPDKG